jgi:hypothetical protein
VLFQERGVVAKTGGAGRAGERRGGGHKKQQGCGEAVVHRDSLQIFVDFVKCNRLHCKTVPMVRPGCAPA